jgi:hypothetical protein
LAFLVKAGDHVYSQGANKNAGQDHHNRNTEIGSFECRLHGAAPHYKKMPKNNLTTQASAAS